jgi:hypothetical protein
MPENIAEYHADDRPKDFDCSNVSNQSKARPMDEV